MGNNSKGKFTGKLLKEGGTRKGDLTDLLSDEEWKRVWKSIPRDERVKLVQEEIDKGK